MCMLFIFVEGPDDRNYFEAVFGKQFKDHKIIEYSREKKEKISEYLRSINSMPNSDYLFFGDEDGKGIENRKEALLGLYRNLSCEKLYIVQYEIESWYYAGTSRDDCCRLKLKSYQEDTSTLTKEQFQSKLSRPSERKYIMSQILMCYSKELAQSRNNSFCCFNTYVKHM